MEDDADLRDIFQEMLAGDQREVVACATVEEALVLWNASHFDVLVTDNSLPGMSGTDLARRVLATHPDRWVVICSGYEYGDAIRTLGQHVRALPKPFELEELERLLIEIVVAQEGTR